MLVEVAFAISYVRLFVSFISFIPYLTDKADKRSWESYSLEMSFSSYRYNIMEY
jgi:hypothetical protein